MSFVISWNYSLYLFLWHSYLTLYIQNLIYYLRLKPESFFPLKAPKLDNALFLFFYYLFIIIFFICSGFCHTLKWNSHGFTCVPHPNNALFLCHHIQLVIKPLILLLLYHHWACVFLPSPPYCLGWSQELINFYYKGPNGKQLRLCGLRDLCQNYLMLSLQLKGHTK